MLSVDELRQHVRNVFPLHTPGPSCTSFFSSSTALIAACADPNQPMPSCVFDELDDEGRRVALGKLTSEFCLHLLGVTRAKPDRETPPTPETNQEQPPETASVPN